MNKITKEMCLSFLKNHYRAKAGEITGPIGIALVLLYGFVSPTLFAIMAGVGAPIPLEFHTSVSYSVVLGFNVYDMFDKLYIKLMDW